MDPFNRQERIRRTGGDTGKVFAEETGGLIGKQHRSTAGRMDDESTRGTGDDAIVALRTPFKKEQLWYSTRGPQPINTSQRRGWLHWEAISMLNEFLSRFDRRTH